MAERYVYLCRRSSDKLLILIADFICRGYAVRAHTIEVESETSDNPTSGAVFCFVFTKMKPGGPLICDMQLSSTEKLTRCKHATILRVCIAIF